MKSKSSTKQHYDDWLEGYELTHPRPERQTRKEKLQWFIILTAVVYYSGRHNISFLKNQSNFDILTSISIVIMLEGILIKAGERITKYLPVVWMKKARLSLSLLLATMALIVAISGNRLDLLRSKGFSIDPETERNILNIVGHAAPLMAIFAGVMFTSIDMEEKEALAEYTNIRNREWGKYKRKLESRRLDMSDARLSNQTDTRQTGAGFNRASTAVDNAKQYLLDNPDKMELSLRELSALIPDAGKDSIGKAKKLIQQNGHLDHTN